MFLPAAQRAEIGQVLIFLTLILISSSRRESSKAHEAARLKNSSRERVLLHWAADAPSLPLPGTASNNNTPVHMLAWLSGGEAEEFVLFSALSKVAS